MVLEKLLTMSNDKEKSRGSDEEKEDVISSAIGEYGRWQFYLTFLLSLFNIPCTWHIFVSTFNAVDTDVMCARPERFRHVSPAIWRNFTQPDNNYCHIFNVSQIELEELNTLHQIGGMQTIPCTEWEFLEEDNTLIREFALLCDQSTLNNVADMMFFSGVAIGGLVSGILSDKYGRKKTLMTSVLIQTIIGVVTAFVPWFHLYSILRAILGFISVSVVFSGFVLSIELVGGKWRTVAGISYLFPNSLGYISIAGMAYLVRDWRKLQLAISLPGCLFLALWWVLPESPRWLQATGRTEEVMRILEKAASVNGKELPLNLDKQLLPQEEEVCTESVNVWDLFRTRQMRKKTLLNFVIWFGVYLVYYGLTLNLNNIGGDLYLNSILSGAVEVPAIAITILILLRGGRRWPLALTMITAGLACAFSAPIKLMCSDLQWVITTLTMIGRFCISSSNAIMPVFTAELYPTIIRNIGVGASNVSAGMALMLVPYLWLSSALHKSVPMSVIAACGVVGGVCVLFLPETGSKPLRNTMKEEVDSENNNS